MPTPSPDLTGEKIGNWTVLHRTYGRNHGHYLCACSCGNEEREIRIQQLRELQTKLGSNPHMPTGCADCKSRERSHNRRLDRKSPHVRHVAEARRTLVVDRMRPPKPFTCQLCHDDPHVVAGRWPSCPKCGRKAVAETIRATGGISSSAGACLGAAGHSPWAGAE